MPTRQQIIDEARSYIGTPFHHCGRLKGVGVDCIGLLTGVAKTFDITHHDLPEYSRTPDGTTLMNELRKCLAEIPVEEALPGDVYVMWTSRPELPRHAAILSNEGRIIHTWSDIGYVCEHTIDDSWRKRICGAFRFPGVE